MNTLYFFKADRAPSEQSATSQIVILLTAQNDFQAMALGYSRISDAYRASYPMATVEPVCRTPDTVEAFEPV